MPWPHHASADPSRLNLRLVCTEKIPATEMVGAFAGPTHHHQEQWRRQQGKALATLLPHSRTTVAYVKSRSHMPRVQEPFPQLTSLELAANDEMAAIVPFLIPRLQIGNQGVPELKKKTGGRFFDSSGLGVLDQLRDTSLYMVMVFLYMYDKIKSPICERGFEHPSSTVDLSVYVCL